MEEKRYLVDGLPDDTIRMDVVHKAFRFLFTDELGQYLLELLGIHYASCVVDTNVLLRDISWTLKKQRTSSLVLAARVGTLRLYASTQVRAKVPKKIRTRATSFKMDPEAACQLWNMSWMNWRSG